jgi:hypothetical protein
LPAVILLLVLIKKKISANKSFLILFTLGLFYIFLTHNKSTFIWLHIPGMSYIQFPWRFLGVATFCLALASGAVFQFFAKQRLILSIVIAAAVIALNFPFFKEDIWYSVNDSYFTTGAEWNRQRTASIGDYWPLFGHDIPNEPSDGRFINYFPGWVGAEPNKDGLIPAEGTDFKDTPVRKAGNLISLFSILGFGVFSAITKKWKEKA